MNQLFNTPYNWTLKLAVLAPFLGKTVSVNGKDTTLTKMLLIKCLFGFITIKPYLRNINDMSDEEMQQCISAAGLSSVKSELTGDVETLPFRYIRRTDKVRDGYPFYMYEIGNLGCSSWVNGATVADCFENNPPKVHRYLCDAGFDIHGLIEKNLANPKPHA